MTKDYTLYLKDILEAMESIEQFVKGLTFDNFTKDDKTASAVIRKFEIIGGFVFSIRDLQLTITPSVIIIKRLASL